MTPKFNQINVLIHSNTRVTAFKSSFFPLFDACMNTKYYFHAYMGQKVGEPPETSLRQPSIPLMWANLSKYSLGRINRVSCYGLNFGFAFFWFCHLCSLEMPSLVSPKYLCYLPPIECLYHGCEIFLSVKKPC